MESIHAGVTSYTYYVRVCHDSGDAVYEEDTTLAWLNAAQKRLDDGIHSVFRYVSQRFVTRCLPFCSGCAYT